MPRLMVLVSALLFATAVQAQSADDVAIAFVKKLGGTADRDKSRPGKPVVRIQLVNRALQDDGLKQFTGLKGLRVLLISETEITDAGLKHLKDLSLETLDVGDTDVTDRGLKEIAAIKTLTGLDLWDAGDGGRA